MIRFTEADMTALVQTDAELAAMWNQTKPAVRTMVLRRMHEFAYTGITAMELNDAVKTSGHSDPTLAQAFSERGRGDDLVAVALLHLWTSRLLKRALTDYLRRNPHPTPEKAKATDVGFDSDSVFRPGEGTCDACGRPYPGGKKRSERVHPCDGKMLCYSHLTGRKSPEHAGRTIDDYIASVQRWMSTRGIPRGGNLDHVSEPADLS